MKSANTPATIAEMLLDATGTRFAIKPPRVLIPGLNVEDAYLIQQLQERARMAQGKKIAGRKIGLTSQAMQEQLGVASPDFGFFTEDLVFHDGDSIPANRFIDPRVEPELGFILDRELGSEEDLDSVAGAIRSCHTAIEIIDSRVQNWDITLVDTIADNASCGAVVLGPAIEVTADKLPEVSAAMTVNGEHAAAGAGSDVLGHPLQPLVWLAKTLAARGVPLRAGELILTGSFCAATPMGIGDEVTVDYGEHGRLSATFH